MRALFFLLLRRLASRLEFNQFARDSHRKSGVLSFLVLLSPVDSCNPPELKELTNCLYARGMRDASEKKKKIEAEGISRILSGLTCGFLRQCFGMQVCVDCGWQVPQLVVAIEHVKPAGIPPHSKKTDRPICRAVQTK
jgi:hypothetical protein